MTLVYSGWTLGLEQDQNLMSHIYIRIWQQLLSKVQPILLPLLYCHHLLFEIQEGHERKTKTNSWSLF